MFLQGAQGDVNHINVNPTKEQTELTKIDFDGVPRGIKYTEYMGKTIANACLSVYDKVKEIDSSVIAFGEKIISLPSNKENDKL